MATSRTTLTVHGITLLVEPWKSHVREPGSGDVYPDGCMDVLWFEGRLAIAGPATRRLEVEQLPGARSAGLRFPGGTLSALLGIPGHVLLDEVVPLDEVWRGAQERWGPRVSDSATPATALAGLIREYATTPSVKMSLLSHIERQAVDGASVAKIAEEIGYSERQLRRLCLDAFGYGPRTLGRIHRFVAASNALRAGGRASDVAVDHRYADQPHMVREFRTFTGRTPTWFAPKYTEGRSPCTTEEAV